MTLSLRRERAELKRITMFLVLALAASVLGGCSAAGPKGASDGASPAKAGVPSKDPTKGNAERPSKMVGRTVVFLQHQDNAVDPSKYAHAKMDGEPSDIPFFKPAKDEGVHPRDYADHDATTFKFLALPSAGMIIPPQSYYMFRKGSLNKALAPTGYKAVELLDSGHVKILPNLYIGYYDFAWISLNVMTEYWSGNESMNQELWSVGNDYVIVASSSNGGVSLIAPPEVKSVKDLAGKKIGIMNPSYNQEALFNKKLESLGMATESAGGDVGVEMGSPGVVMNDLMDNDVSAVMAWGSYENTLREKFKYRELVGWDEMGYGSDVPYSVLVVRKDILAKHPDIVQTVVQQNYDATQKAIKVGDYKKPEYARVERYWAYDMGTPKKVSDMRVKELVQLDAEMNVRFLRDVYDYMSEYGYFQVPYRFDELVDPGFQDKLRK